MTRKFVPQKRKGQFLLGNLPEFRRDRLGFLTRCAREQGDMVVAQLGANEVWLLNHPDLIEEVLVEKYRHFIKGPGLRGTRGLLGNGLLISEGDFWRRQRKLAQPGFHRDRIAAYGAIMVDYTERLLATWRDSESLDIHAELMRLTAAIVSKTLFDADVAEDASAVSESIDTVQEGYLRRLNSLIKVPDWVPTPANRKLRAAVQRLDSVVYGFINRRRAGGDDRGDLLSMLLATRDDDGAGMSDQQLRDEVITLFLAGHETTAIALSWAFYLLAERPSIVLKLTQELDTVLAGRPPQVSDRPNLRYTEMVIQETLRLYPPAWTVGREAIEPCEIGGYPVKPGTKMLMSQWVMHRDPRYFEEPEKFIPERWENDLARQLPRHVYFPFGSGPRVCIGNTFAQMEAVLLLATIAQRFTFCRTEKRPVVPRAMITLRPEGGIRLELQRRTRQVASDPPTRFPAPIGS